MQKEGEPQLGCDPPTSTIDHQRCVGPLSKRHTSAWGINTWRCWPPKTCEKSKIVLLAKEAGNIGKVPLTVVAQEMCTLRKHQLHRNG